MLFNQMVRAARLDKKLYTELFFDSYATGNSVLAVALVYGVIYVAVVLGSPLVGFDLIGFLWFMLGGIVGWLIVAGGLWLASTKVFQGHGSGATAVRLTGFSHAPLLLLAAGPFVPSGLVQLVVAVALLWFGATLAVAAQAVFDVDLRQSALSALIAIALWWVLQMIGIGGDLARIFRPF